MWFGIVFAILVEIVPLSCRSTTVGVFLFVMNNVGGNLPILVDPVSKAIGYREAIMIFYAGFYALSKDLFYTLKKPCWFLHPMNVFTQKNYNTCIKRWAVMGLQLVTYVMLRISQRYHKVYMYKPYDYILEPIVIFVTTNNAIIYITKKKTIYLLVIWATVLIYLLSIILSLQSFCNTSRASKKKQSQYLRSNSWLMVWFMPLIIIKNLK